MVTDLLNMRRITAYRFGPLHQTVIQAELGHPPEFSTFVPIIIFQGSSVSWELFNVFFNPSGPIIYDVSIFRGACLSKTWPVTHWLTRSLSHTLDQVSKYGPVWYPMVLYGLVWSSMVLYGPLWSSCPPWSCMVPYDPLWSTIVPYGSLWSSLVPYGPLWAPLVLYGPKWSLWSYVVLNGWVWSSMVSYGPPKTCYHP